MRLILDPWNKTTVKVGPDSNEEEMLVSGSKLHLPRGSDLIWEIEGHHLQDIISLDT